MTKRPYLMFCLACRADMEDFEYVDHESQAWLGGVSRSHCLFVIRARNGNV